jgi:hypothetical protein
MEVRESDERTGRFSLEKERLLGMDSILDERSIHFLSFAYRSRCDLGNMDGEKVVCFMMKEIGGRD